MSSSASSTPDYWEAALLASHRLMGTRTQIPTKRSLTPPPEARPSLPQYKCITPRAGITCPRASRETARPTMPQTLHHATSPSTPSAPRKRSRFKYESSKVSAMCTPRKRARATPSLSSATPSKRLGRKTILPFDKTICIPMHVLRAQVDDTSALLRTPPKASDRLRKAVDASVRRECAKLDKGAVGIMEAAVLVLGRTEGGVESSTSVLKKGGRRVKK